VGRRILDTNILINHWGERSRERRVNDTTIKHATNWARELISLQRTNTILTPVYIEYVCGKGTEYEVKLARAYLSSFTIADGGRILPQDWEQAKLIAARVNRDGSRRQMGDCLIRAICNRLHYEVFTADKRFPN